MQIDTSSFQDVVKNEYAVYDEHTLFVEPMYIIDLRQSACMTLKLSLPKLLETNSNGVDNKGRIMMSLLNRARNKPIFLQQLREQLTTGKLKLLDISKLFVRLNAVYKQASIERQAVKRKDMKERPKPLF